MDDVEDLRESLMVESCSLLLSLNETLFSFFLTGVESGSVSGAGRFFDER